MDWSEIILGVLGFLGAVIAGGITLKIISKRTSRLNLVSQKNNVAGGDIVGGDKVTNRNK